MTHDELLGRLAVTETFAVMAVSALLQQKLASDGPPGVQQAFQALGYQTAARLEDYPESAREAGKEHLKQLLEQLERMLQGLALAASPAQGRPI